MRLVLAAYGSALHQMEENMEKVRVLLGLPEEVAVSLPCLLLGYPAESTARSRTALNRNGCICIDPTTNKEAGQPA